MSTQPRSTLRRVLHDLGDSFLELLTEESDPSAVIGPVVLYDPECQPEIPENAVVLGLGVTSADEISAAVADLAAKRAVALVLRMPVDSSVLPGRSERKGLAVLGLARGATWAQLFALLRSLVAEPVDVENEPLTMGGIPSGDMFAVANAVSALIDAPVTIEDPVSRVLAFSGRQDEADPARVATILGRQVPEEARSQIGGRGIYEALVQGDGPVYMEPLTLASGEFSMPRVAVPVHAGEEFLGSIWAAVPGPLPPATLEAFVDAAKLVALHLLQVRAGGDIERRLRAELVGTVLEGGGGALEAAGRLGLLGRRVTVLAVSVPALPADAGAADHARRTAERQRLRDALGMHLSALHSGSAVALIGESLYAMVPVAESDTTPIEQAARAARSFLERSNSAALIGVGSVADDPGGLPRSRADADRALRVLGTGAVGGQVATLEDVHLDAVLLELNDLNTARGHGELNTIRRLRDYDAEHGSRLVETLRHWLEAFGDVPAAAAATYVHPNTFRYRLRRLAEIGMIDLSDHDQRFAAQLQLRMAALVDRQALPARESR